MITPDISRRIADLYSRMESAYDKVAAALDFSCKGCPDNCCDSFFQHHTYVEWAYLWEGMKTLSEKRRKSLIERAEICAKECDETLAKGERPCVMCPLNEDGLCVLYPYRLMICRMHGIPSSFMRPDGIKISFPGCFRCQEQVESKNDTPVLDRTELYRELADLEVSLLGARRHTMPKVKLTLAQMLVKGPPGSIEETCPP
ncbi:MAG: hypothetical protein U9O82_06085 [Thermodesulfobacteriota bacterium]|nr:hypothetical protein [Thermodesulfobacteriota bacterium]